MTIRPDDPSNAEVIKAQSRVHAKDYAGWTLFLTAFIFIWTQFVAPVLANQEKTAIWEARSDDWKESVNRRLDAQEQKAATAVKEAHAAHNNAAESVGILRRTFDNAPSRSGVKRVSK